MQWIEAKIKVKRSFSQPNGVEFWDFVDSCPLVWGHCSTPGVLIPRYPRGCLSAIESGTLVFKLSLNGSRTELYLAKMVFIDLFSFFCFLNHSFSYQSLSSRTTFKVIGSTRKENSKRWLWKWLEGTKKVLQLKGLIVQVVPNGVTWPFVLSKDGHTDIYPIPCFS